MPTREAGFPTSVGPALRFAIRAREGFRKNGFRATNFGAHITVKEEVVMLFMLKANIAKPANVSNKEFYTVWRHESEAALGAVKAGAIKGIWKVAGRPIIIAVLDVPSADDLDHAIHELPIWKMGYAHIAADMEILPLRPYENWAEDLKELSKG
jgi:muconolactone delta-isomerase